MFIVYYLLFIAKAILNIYKERSAFNSKMRPKTKKIMDKLVEEIEKAQERSVISLIEEITIRGSKQEKKVKVKIDTGASKSSIEKTLLQEIGPTPIMRKVLVTSPHIKEVRPLIMLQVKLGNKCVNSTFTVTSRKNMKYRVLLGRNTLKELCVLIDPLKPTKKACVK